MKLSEMFPITGLAASKVILVGAPEPTDVLDRDKQPYFRFNLAEPITVRCSTDKDMPALENVTEIYMRSKDVDEATVTFVNGKDAAEGYFVEGWKADFSTTQEMPIYQATTINEWRKSDRQVKGDERKLSLAEKIKKANELKKQANS